MKKIILTLSVVLALASCSEKVAPPEQNSVAITPPTLVPSGFLTIEPEHHRFVDTAFIKKQSDSPKIFGFDVVTNLTQGIYTYGNNQDYAKSMKKSYILNCQSRSISEISKTYYSEFWGTGVASSTEESHSNVVRSYTDSPLHLLGKLICAELYLDKPVTKKNKALIK